MLQLVINGKLTDIPADLTEITLGRFLAYWDQHGRELDKKLQEIEKQEYEDPFLRDLDLLDQEQAEAIAWYSFFTGYDFSTVPHDKTDLLLSHYRIIKEGLINSEMAAYQFPMEVFWKEELWEISDWKITPGSSFTFNELLTSKEITRQVYAIGKGKWEALPYLCAVFFRKKGEAFKDTLVEDGSERLKLMGELPMDTALQVAFFLTSSVITLARALAVSKDRAPVMPV